MSLLSRLASQLRPYRRVLAGGVLLLAATNLCGMLLPWLLMHGIDALGAADPAQLLLVCGAMVFAALLRAGTRILSRLCFFRTARRFEVDLRQQLLARLLQQPRPFFDRHRTGDLLSRLSNDLTNLRMLAGFGLLTLVNTGLAYLMTLGFLLALSPRLTLVALFPYPLLILAVQRLSRRLHHHSARVQEGLAQVSNAVEEGVSGLRVIRAFAWSDLHLETFANINADYLERNLALARLRSLLLPLMTVCAPLGTLLVFFIGGPQLVGGQLSLGELVAFNAYLMQLAWPTLLAGWVLSLAQRAAASYDRIRPLLELPIEAAGLPPAWHSAPGIRLRELSVRLGERPVLDRLSLEIPAGTLVGLAGVTASGKTTLIRALAGLYPVEPGMVEIGGRDLVQLDPRAYRRELTIVPQEGRLFSGTIADNLCYAEPEAVARLAELADQVQLTADLGAFPEGWETRVGEGGLTLSGGQRQRVAIGRALARPAGIWLLDDPFSHLDAATAHRLWGELRPLLRGCTVILASSRVRLLEQADRVAVLDRGRLVEDGTPAELLAAPSVFARLSARERLSDEVEAWS